MEHRGEDGDVPVLVTGFLVQVLLERVVVEVDAHEPGEPVEQAAQGRQAQLDVSAHPAGWGHSGSTTVPRAWGPPAPGGDGPALLDGLDLTVRPGETVAVLGPSGVGKSSLAALLVRFWTPQHGIISLDGHPLDELTEQVLPRVVGYVPQQVYLFADTVAGSSRTATTPACWPWTESTGGCSPPSWSPRSETGKENEGRHPAIGAPWWNLRWWSRCLNTGPHLHSA